MKFTEFRLKFRHFINRNKKILIVVLSIWAIVISINYLLKNRKVETKPITTYEPHVSVMDSAADTPKSMQDPIEQLIEEYVEACNNGNYQKAFNMLSVDCKEYEFNNDITRFMSHVLTKMPLPKEYTIQNYSNIQTSSLGKVYVYEIKYTDDMLATGLTNSEYQYTSEKMTFYRKNDGTIQMSIGNYIYHSNVQSISENEYLKLDIIDKLVNYSTEKYQVKITNRSEYTIVIADGYGKNEICLELTNELRAPEEIQNIVLKPGESITKYFEFPKFADDGDTSESISFSTIRVMEQYSGVENIDEAIIQSEIDKAIAKFSMSVAIKEK